MYVDNKNVRVLKIKATQFYCVHSINTCSFIFMTDIPWAKQGCPKGQMWPTSRQMPRSGLKAIQSP